MLTLYLRYLSTSLLVSHAFCAPRSATNTANQVKDDTLLDLEVDTAPRSPQPYIIRHYANANATQIGSQIYRFPVTGNSSGGAFSLLSTNAPGSSALGVLPHIHERHFENFFNFKGRYQLWAQYDGEQQTRVLTAGDYGAVPPGTNHTFQIIDPDTELVGAIVPGGFEDLFFALGTPWTSLTETPYVPITDPIDNSSSSTSGPSAEVISSLESFDVYAQLDFSPRRDAINGTAPQNTTWHSGFNALPNDTTTPYFIANGWGPKYLAGANDPTLIPYHVIQPLVSGNVSGNDYDYTLSKISINKPRWYLNVNDTFASASSSTSTMSRITSTQPSAFEVIEGLLELNVSGYKPANLTSGDVAFLPASTEYAYQSIAAFTQVLYISLGSGGLDQELIRSGIEWEFVTFPTS